MANPPSLIMGYMGSNNQEFSTTQDYWPIALTAGLENGETGSQNAFLAGTASKLWCRVITSSTATATLVLRVNQTNGNMSVSITASTTGAFTDSLNSNSINGNDKVCYGLTDSQASLVLTIMAFTFVATTAGTTISKLGFSNEVPSFSALTNNVTQFSTPSGGSSVPQTESQAKLRIRKALTAKNLSWTVNGSTGTTTVHSRKNGANGNFSPTLPTSLGLVQDTSNSDVLAVGDDYNFSFVNGATAQNPAFIACSMDFVSSAGDCIFACGYDGLTQFNTSVTAYAGLSGSLDTTQTTETNAKVTVNSAFVFSELTTNITSNGITSGTSVTITLRTNSGNTSLAISAINNQTGVLSDSSAGHNYTAAPTDAMNYSVVTGAAGTNLKLSFIEVYGNATAAAPAGGPSYQHFRNTARKGKQDYNSFGGQMVVFG